MAHILIIGFGNPMRSDDRVGWEVALRLKQTLSHRQTQVIAAHQLTPEMAELASRAERMLFIDASQDGLPGAVRCENVEPAVGGSFTHELTPAAILELSRTLYGRAPAAKLLTVVGESFEIGEEMSRVVADEIPLLIAEAQRFVQDGKL